MDKTKKLPWPFQLEESRTLPEIFGTEIYRFRDLERLALAFLAFPPATFLPALIAT
jgi:hypothetical protein